MTDDLNQALYHQELFKSNIISPITIFLMVFGVVFKNI